ncbi:hypothetical protein ACJX0J_006334, partial [Zea mays]
KVFILISGWMAKMLDVSISLLMLEVSFLVDLPTNNNMFSYFFFSEQASFCFWSNKGVPSEIYMYKENSNIFMLKDIWAVCKQLTCSSIFIFHKLLL